MNACLRNVNLLDHPCEALIYSTNVLLNCSGGVGACLVERYGIQVQKDLHALLRQGNRRFVEQGDVVQLVSRGMPYKLVFHTAPCNGFYETDSKTVAEVLNRCLRICQEVRVRSVAMSALATGYGHLEFEEFFRVVAHVLAGVRYPELQSATICVEHEFSFKLAAKVVSVEGLPIDVGGGSSF